MHDRPCSVENVIVVISLLQTTSEEGPLHRFTRSFVMVLNRCTTSGNDIVDMG
jgi:hypothetical protein